MSDEEIEVTALAVNVTIPDHLRWTDIRRGDEFTLMTLNVRLLPDGRLAAKAYGRPTAGGRGAYVSFAVPDRPSSTSWSPEPAPARPSCGRRTAVWGDSGALVCANSHVRR